MKLDFPCRCISISRSPANWSGNIAVFPSSLTDSAWLQDALNVLDVLRIDIVGQGTNFNLLGKLAVSYALTPYDVAYFHLARMMELPIASRDRGIIAACKNWNVLHWTPAFTAL